MATMEWRNHHHCRSSLAEQLPPPLPGVAPCAHPPSIPRRTARPVVCADETVARQARSPPLLIKNGMARRRRVLPRRTGDEGEGEASL